MDGHYLQLGGGLEMMQPSGGAMEGGRSLDIDASIPVSNTVIVVTRTVTLGFTILGNRLSSQLSPFQIFGSTVDDGWMQGSHILLRMSVGLLSPSNLLKTTLMD